MRLSGAFLIMKKLYSFVISLLFVVSAFNTPVVNAAPLADQAAFTLEELGLDQDMIMHGPYDTDSIRFDLPASWVLMDGAELELEISSFFAGDGNLASDLSNNYLGAMLDVYFNDKLQQSIPLSRGEKVIYRIPIAANDLTSPYDGGWYKISFFLDAAIDCDFDFHKTTVVIGLNSRALFPYAKLSPRLDLHRLPWPIYQERANVPESVALVVPSSPSEDELQASLIVMGTFGRMTGGKLPITMIVDDQLTGDILNKSNLIFVGKPSAFPILQDAQLPISFVDNAFSSKEVEADDGVLQIFSSPWDNTKSILLVSGNTEQAVVKAAQALSTGNLQTGTVPTYSVVAQVNPVISTGVVTTEAVQITSSDFTLADLGYPFLTATSIGANYLTYEFVIPLGQVPAESPYMELKYNGSVLLDPSRSSIIIYLNGALIGSAKFSTENSNFSSYKIDLPLSVLRPGINRLEFVADLIPFNDCSIFSSSGIWATIYPETALHLPLIPASISSISLGGLNTYPYPFANDPTYSTTSFVVPKQSQSSWFIAGDIAYDLGSRAQAPILAFETFFDSQIPEDIKTQNLIVVGEPKDLKIVSELKSALPAIFENGSNIAVLDSQQVIYRITDEKSLGYLELFVSPWGEESAILGVFGTTTDGLGFASKALLDFQTRGTLTGNFITLDGDKAIVVDTQTGLGIGRFEPGLGPDVITETKPTPAIQDYESARANLRREVFYGIAGVVVLMAIVALVALILRKRNI